MESKQKSILVQNVRSHLHHRIVREIMSLQPAQLAFETVFMTAASKNVFVRVYGAILITYLIELKILEPVHTQLALN